MIAQLDIVQSNSMVEAVNKIIKHRYLYRHVIGNTEELVKLLPKIITDYNDMPLACLYGLTPNEVLAGAVPDKEKWQEKNRGGAKSAVSGQSGARLREYLLTSSCPAQFVDIVVFQKSGL